jgi:hypothetical protein
MPAEFPFEERRKPDPAAGVEAVNEENVPSPDRCRMKVSQLEWGER